MIFVGSVNLLNMCCGDVNLLLKFGGNQDSSCLLYLIQHRNSWRKCGRLGTENPRLFGNCLWPRPRAYGNIGIRSGTMDSAKLYTDLQEMWRSI